MSRRPKVHAPRAHVQVQVDTPAEGVFLPILLLLFVGSGCAALIYEVVWLQLLQLVIGSSAVSLGVLLGTFMGGMCLGSLFLPKYVSPKEHPLRVYALLEVGIGVIGLLALFGVPLVGNVYAAVGGGQGFTGVLARAVLCALCLLPPTMLMGATLPAIARWIGTTGTGVSWLGFFYGANIAGAVAGCLLAGFYLLRVFDMATATYVAVAINLVVAAIGFALATSTPYQSTVDVEPGAGTMASPSRGATLVYVSIALSGLCALGAEVIWTRVLSLMLGATTYTFSIILAVFLIGLGIGSSIGSFLSRSIHSPRAALGWLQLFAALSIAWTAWMLGTSLPYWPVNPWLSTSPWFNFQIDLVRCLWALLPGSLFWGASFPVALAGVAARGQDPGRLVGVVYAANTVGAIVGALGFSMLTVPFIGTHGAQQVLIALAAISALVAFGSARVQNLGDAAASVSGGLAREGSLAALAVLVVVMLWHVPPIPAGLVAYGRSLPTRDETGINYLYKGEGMNSSIAVSQLPGGIRNFHVSGKVEASSEPQDMRLQRMLGNIPAALHSNPKSVLIVGFGAGVTAGSFVPYSDIEKIVICEIEPLIPQRVASYFERENFAVLRDPRVKSSCAVHCAERLTRPCDGGHFQGSFRLASLRQLRLEESMRKTYLVAAGFACSALLGSAFALQAQPAGPDPKMNYFVTSKGIGKGGNLGGIEGADRHCQALAAAAGFGNKTWRAYLSTQARPGKPAINARDRIGTGPWYNYKGVMIARDNAHLHGDTLELARLGNNITKITNLTEKGEVVPGLNDGINPRSREYAYMLEQTVSNRHETLTGSQPDGRAYPPGKDYTCNNWTSEENGTSDNLRQNTGANVQVGMSDRNGGGNGSWNSSHGTVGCSQQNLARTHGIGMYYCFAPN